MTTTELAAGLLWLMPVAMGTTTMVFAVLTIAMARQRNSTRLDWAILALFVMLTLSGAASTYLRWYLYRQAMAEDIDSWIEWSIVVAIVVFPIIESISGMLVLAWSRELDRTEPTNERQDIRESEQNDREEFQGERDRQSFIVDQQQKARESNQDARQLVQDTEQGRQASQGHALDDREDALSE